MKNADMPAMPMLNECGAPHHHSNILVQDGCVTGLSKREHFAGLAMQGILSNSVTMDFIHSNKTSVTEQSVRCADELLKELENE